MTPSQHRARGFTLVEALVALLVLSIGLLGIASLQLTSLRFNQNASIRSQATLLAYDIIDRMRVNSQAAAAGNYNVLFTQTPSGATLAAKDIVAWKANLRSALPVGDGQISRVVNGSTTTYRVAIQWDDSRGDATIGMTTFVMETQL